MGSVTIPVGMMVYGIVRFVSNLPKRGGRLGAWGVPTGDRRPVPGPSRLELAR